MKILKAGFHIVGTILILGLFWGIAINNIFKNGDLGFSAFLFIWGFIWTAFFNAAID